MIVVVPGKNRRHAVDANPADNIEVSTRDLELGVGDNRLQLPQNQDSQPFVTARKKPIRGAPTCHCQQQHQKEHPSQNCEHDTTSTETFLTLCFLCASLFQNL